MTNMRDTQLLNGWWDFQPVPHEDLTQPLDPTEVPADGWQPSGYLVPGFFTDHPYPDSWRQSRSGWARTTFDVSDVRLLGEVGHLQPRAYLTVQAAIPRAILFVNGRRVAAQEDMFIGDEYDVTPYLRPGRNELAILLTEFRTFPHPDNGKLCLIDAPWGCCIAGDQAGIWQDVELQWRAAVHISDVTIRTSVRDNTLTVITEVRNASDAPFHGVLAGHVGQAVSLPLMGFSLQPGEHQTLTQTLPWSDYRPWFPEDPHLYTYHSEIQGVDTLDTRFGFREVWAEGHRILLNGRPQRWRGEWCHKSHSHWLRPEYVRQWFQQIKDLNGNYVRMHTFPHPEYFLDIADEMGLMICQESALHGSGQAGWDTPELWERAPQHVRRMMRRDKNHPSLVIWSVENEMRWSLNIVPGAKDQLPGLRALFNQLDPTRPAYHDGDTSLWNEDEQPIISRHYGPASHGFGWWDKRVPLHSGEMGRWHYASPYHALQWAGDEVFADYRALSQSLALDCARITELARANEVSCTFIWNTSGLDNFRPGEAKTFTWDVPNSRYLKPLAHKPYESEYAWWENSSGYRPGYSFELMRHAFRPLAVVIREERNQFYTDQLAPHTVYVVNDLPVTAEGAITIQLVQGGAALWQHAQQVSVKSGETGTCAVQVPLAALQGNGEATITTTFHSQAGVDVVERAIHYSAPQRRSDRLALPPVALWGKSPIAAWLANHGVQVAMVDESTPLNPRATPILIVGEHVVTPGSTQNQYLRDFVAAGGRALVLEQDYSIFPGVALARMPIEMARVRDALHPALDGITDGDLRFFGDDPFGLSSSDAWVTALPYLKPKDGSVVRALIDSSGGDFGTGGLQWAPLIEAQIGAGVVIASQLRIGDKLDQLPVANRLLCNVLSYLAAPVAKEPANASASTPADMPDGSVELSPGVVLFNGCRAPASSTTIAEGQTWIVWGLTEEARQGWEQVIHRKIDLFTPEHTIYQLIADGTTPLLRGLSNEDTCWLENWTYTQANRKEPIVDQLIRVDGAITHLHNATLSGLDVLYGDDKATEWLRMPALSQYFGASQPRPGAGLIEVPAGKGRVIFCQLRWRPELWQFRRFLNLLLWNLGVPAATDVLAGDCTPTAGRESDGYPLKLRAARGVDEPALAEILSRSKRRAESYSGNLAFRQWERWQEIAVPQGCLDTSALTGSGDVVVGLEVTCPEPRKFMQTIGGLPNPDLQTFLRLQGRGAARVWVNAKPWGEHALNADGPTYVSDIDFEAGSNFVVLAWQPEATDGTLSLCFENKDRRPETTFAFV
jgi:beta-galactosidase